VWGESSNNQARLDNTLRGTPSDKGYTKIYSNWYAFAVLKADGSITRKLMNKWHFDLNYFQPIFNQA
jgi:hypothetical protein